MTIPNAKSETAKFTGSEWTCFNATRYPDVHPRLEEWHTSRNWFASEAASRQRLNLLSHQPDPWRSVMQVDTLATIPCITKRAAFHKNSWHLSIRALPHPKGLAHHFLVSVYSFDFIWPYFTNFANISYVVQLLSFWLKLGRVGEQVNSQTLG